MTNIIVASCLLRPSAVLRTVFCETRVACLQKREWEKMPWAIADT